MHAMQMQVQKHLQLRIEAQGKYMQSILEKACQTLAGENNMPSGGVCYKGIIGNNQAAAHHDHNIKDFTTTSPLSFPSFQDLNLYDAAGGDHHGFMSNNDNICVAKKRLISPNNNNYIINTTSTTAGSSGKSPLVWSDIDLRLQDLGSTAAASSSCTTLGPPDHHSDHDPFKGNHRGNTDIDSFSEAASGIYTNETKPAVISADLGEVTAKLERRSPRRGMSPIVNPTTSSSVIQQARHSPFG